MLTLKYKNLQSVYEVEFTRISESVVQVLGNIPVKGNGFEIYRSDGKTLLGDYSGYRTVYRTVPGGIQYSSDGSVYPQEPKPETTLEDRVEALEEGQEIQDGAIEELAIIALGEV